MAKHRRKRETHARKAFKAARVAAPAAVLLTVSAVSVGVLAGSGPSDATLIAKDAGADISAPVAAAPDAAQLLAQRTPVVSRSKFGPRQVDANPLSRNALATRKAVKNAEAELWTTSELNLWNGAGDAAKQVGAIGEIKKVLVTGRRDNGRAELVRDGQTFWVNAEYLAKQKPDPGPNLGGTCTNGSSVASGVDSDIVKIHQIVCANWPSIGTYGTFRNDGTHGQGRAVDIMISGSVGWEVAEFLRANYSALGIEYIIYSQKIWSVERGGEGWRSMSDRGSTTANHYDHVHVTVF